MPAGAPVPVVKPLPFREAVAAFERRAGNLVTTDRWTEMWQEEHATAFTVARSAGYDILGDISAELSKALGEGDTFETFAKNLKPILQSKGWWGPSQEPDGSVVQLGSMSRLRTIYNVNLRNSYAAGHWERIQRTKHALPFLVYEGVDDARQRPAHHAWMGTLLPVDDPWWDEHYPPCGWNCRCWARQVTQLEAQGLPSKTPASGPPRSFTNTSTGEVVSVPWGIDPGFGYNVGKAALDGKMRADAAKVMADKLASAPLRVAARPLPAEILADQTAEFASWVDTLDRKKPSGDLRVVGALSNRVLDFLDARQVAPESGALTISDHAFSHAMRDAKAPRLPSMETMRALPSLLASPDAVLWDNDDAALLYVISLDGQGLMGTRLVVQLDRSDKVRDQATGKRQTIRTNAIVSAQVMDVDALRDRRRFALVDGSL